MLYFLVVHPMCLKNIYNTYIIIIDFKIIYSIHYIYIKLSIILFSNHLIITILNNK